MNWLLNDLPLHENNTKAVTHIIYFAIYFLKKISPFRL